MLSITLEGPPFERGYQHGQRFADQIRRTIQTYCPPRWFAAPEVKTLEQRLLGSMCAQFPELVIEMVGISKGSGISFDQITLLNLVLATNDLESDALSSTFKLTCTALGFADGDVGPIAGKNCDESPKAVPFYLFQTVRPDRGMAYMCISWVGTVWAEAGLNEAGLALMQTAGPSAPNQDGHGIVCNIAPRPVIEQCRTTQEAVEMLARMDVAGWGMGAVIADTAGNLVTIEKSYDHHAVMPAQDGVSFCTNHFVHPAMQGMLPIAHEGIAANSVARYGTLTTLFRQLSWPRTGQGLKSALAYHGEAGFVCQHGDAGLYSNYYCIAFPRTRQLWLGDGNPCQGQYTIYHL
jgi:isopenicillin-N N-acyltransferase-like protein